jgi:phosphoglucosamine mutase
MKQKRYFGTDGIRGRVGQPPISADWILKLGWAVGTALAQKNKHRPKVLIGKDTRISGYLLESALEAGLSSAGVDILLLGPMPTPGIAYLTRTLRANIGIVISASHNPFDDNGVKFFSSLGTKLSDEFEWEIEELLERPLTTVDSKTLGKATRIADAEGRYVEFCKNTFPAELALNSLKLVIDCANGATYRIAPEVFRELGAEVIEIGVKPDGFNINDRCGSTYPELLAKRVLEEKAHAGIAFDGDGDRVIMIDAVGHIVDGDEILFIIAKWYAETKRLSGGVVGTVMSNYGLEIALQACHIPFSRTAVGDRHVLEMLQKNAWNLGGESSGHIICLDANTTGDGIVSALRVLAVMVSSGRSLQELKQGMRKCPQVLINVPVDNAKRVSLDDPKLQLAIKAAEDQLKGQGRVLLRPSGTEAVVRVMVEGEDREVITAVAERLATAVIAYR